METSLRLRPSPRPPVALSDRIWYAASRATLALWAAASLLVGAYLLAGHLFALPAPLRTDPRLARTLAGLHVGAPAPRWTVVHALYEACPCSRKILDHLVARRAAPGVTERVLIVDGNGASLARARAAGFAAESLSSEAMRDRYGLEAAPVMIVADATDHARYLGGYTDRKQAPVIRDLEVLARVRAGETVAALPLFGCAVSVRLQDAVDPLGLRR